MPEERLLDDRLNIAGQKLPTLSARCGREIRRQNPSTQRYPDVRCVMQGLADYPWGRTGNFLKEQATRQGAHSEVADALQKAVPCKQERRPNVLVI